MRSEKSTAEIKELVNKNHPNCPAKNLAAAACKAFIDCVRMSACFFGNPSTESASYFRIISNFDRLIRIHNKFSPSQGNPALRLS